MTLFSERVEKVKVLGKFVDIFLMLKFQWSRAKLMVQSQTYALLTTIQPSLTARHIWKGTQMIYRSCGDAKEFRHE